MVLLLTQINSIVITSCSVLRALSLMGIKHIKIKGVIC